MQPPPPADPHWPALLARLSGVLDLDASARASGALRRRREVAEGATLLRLALPHGPGGLSLRSAAAWVGMSGVAALSDVALRTAAGGAASAGAAPLAGRRNLRIVDASTISHPGSTGTAWRLHACYDPGASRFADLESTDAHGVEGFARFDYAEGEVAIGDRGHARPRGLQHALAAGADFIVRVGWYSLRMVTPDGEPSNRKPIHEALAPGEVTERQVVVTRHSKGAGRRGKPLFPARLVVMHQRALRAARRQHSRRRSRKEPQPLTLASAGRPMSLTSLPAEAASATEMFAAYRLRWQVELAFKRLESGLGIDRLLARDSAMARWWLLAHLILALLMEDAASEILDARPVRQACPTRPLSLWRLNALLRNAVLGAVLRTASATAIVQAAALLVRHICDPPRRRLSQAAGARAAAPTDGERRPARPLSPCAAEWVGTRATPGPAAVSLGRSGGRLSGPHRPRPAARSRGQWCGRSRLAGSPWRRAPGRAAPSPPY